MNRTILIGYLGRDPELRYTQSSQAVLNIRMATTESYLNREKERQERTEWHTVVVWGKRAEALNRFLGKGDRICVEGRLQTHSWEANDGGKRYSTEIVATNIVLLGNGKSSNRVDDDDAVPATAAAPGGDGLAENEMPF
jgi:single-strand DNA-binding protein